LYTKHNNPANQQGYLEPVRAEPRLGLTTDGPEGRYSLTLRRLLQILWKRLWIILLAVAVLTGATLGLDLAREPTYEASIEILVGQEVNTEAAPGTLSGDVQGLQLLTQTMAKAVDSRRLAKAVVRQENLRMTPNDFLENHLSVEQVEATQFILVDYNDSNPERTQRVANAIGKVFSEQVSDVSASANAITASVWERAALPEEPVSPNPVRDGLLALVLGLMLGVGLAFLFEYLDNRWRSPEELEQVSGVPTFGVIPSISIPKGKKGGT
jgi:capsular polysaccharide biosynthesis protein